MKKTYKITAVISLFLLVAAGLSADDFDFSEFTGESDTTAGSESSLEVGGQVQVPLRLYTGDFFDFWAWDLFNTSNWDFDDISSDSFEIQPELILDLSYDRSRTGFAATLDISENSIVDYPEDLLEELTVSWYGDRATTSLGYQTVVWGKGDKVHALDVLNPLDYSDFTNQDYIDRKISQPMVKMNIPLGVSGLAELVWVPIFTPDRHSTEGRWVPDEIQGYIDDVQSCVGFSAVNTYAATYAAATGGGLSTTQAEGMASAAQTAYLSSHSSLEDFQPDTNALKYGQAALHFTSSLGGVDFGGLYYYGRNRTPSIVIDGPTAEDVRIDYDRTHVFGLEAGSVLFGFNLRGELAYYMTDDFDGNDYAVHNPNLRFVAGFDRDVPINNMNINLQFTGKYTLMKDGIKAANDVEINSELDRTMLILNISDDFKHGKVKPEFVVGFGLEAQDGFVRPGLKIDTDGSLSWELSGTAFFGDDDTLYGQFGENGFVQFEATYDF